MRGTEDYTKIVAKDQKEFNAHHHYKVVTVENGENVTDIYFQKGPIKECGVNGCHHEDLIAIVIDRLESFQDSEYRCRENALAITKLDEALHWLRHRTVERKTRGVEGTSAV